MRARHRRPVMYFAGLDAHLKYVTVAVLDRAGAIVLETTVPTRTPERLLAVLAPFRPLEVVVETCPFWPWLYDLLVPAGIGFHLAHAKRLRAIATAPQKTDAVDARLLGRMLLSGLIPEAYPRPGDQRELLRLLRHRTTLVRYRTRLAGRIHSQLHQQRLTLPREHPSREHSPGRESLGPRGARLGDPEPRAHGPAQLGDPRLRAAHGAAWVAGRAGGGRAEVTPDHLRDAAPQRGVAQRAAAGDDGRDEVQA